MCKKDWRLLQAYKATGLTPEQVQENQKLLAKFQRHGMEPCDYAGVKAYRDQRDKAIADLDKLITTTARLSADFEHAKLDKAAMYADIQRCCATCANCSENNGTGEICPYNFDCNQVDGDHWEWRGAVGTLKRYSTMISMHEFKKILAGGQAIGKPPYAACMHCGVATWNPTICNACTRKYIISLEGEKKPNETDPV